MMAASEAIGKEAGAQDFGSVEGVTREAAPAITVYADQIGYTDIVMGTGDKSGFKGLVLGLVAAEVVAQAHCTVTVAL